MKKLLIICLFVTIIGNIFSGDSKESKQKSEQIVDIIFNYNGKMLVESGKKRLDQEGPIVTNLEELPSSTVNIVISPKTGMWTSATGPFKVKSGYQYDIYEKDKGKCPEGSKLSPSGALCYKKTKIEIT